MQENAVNIKNNKKKSYTNGDVEHQTMTCGCTVDMKKCHRMSYSFGAGGVPNELIGLG